MVDIVALTAIVDQKQLTQKENAMEILNYAETLLKDAEERVDDLQSRQEELEIESKTLGENIDSLTRIKAQTDLNIHDLDVTVQAQLSLIDSLKKAKIKVRKD